MASIPSLKCPEKGCDLMVTGHDIDKLMEFLKVHKHNKHWNIGRLPNEILFKILGYLVPDCEDCFQQREILKLASVSKRFNELVKAPDFYKEIKIGLCSTHPSPSMTDIYGIIRRSGSQLTRITYEIPKPIYNAQLYTEYFNAWVKEFANLMTFIHEHNLTALTLLEIGTFQDELKLTMTMKRGSGPIYRRIESLRIDHHMIDSRYLTFFDKHTASFACSAISAIQSLEQVKIRRYINVPITEGLLSALILDVLDSEINEYYREDNLTRRDNEKRRKAKDGDPETAFKNFLVHLLEDELVWSWNT